MQASRTAHYAWLYRGGSQRSQARAWPNEGRESSSRPQTSTHPEPNPALGVVMANTPTPSRAAPRVRWPARSGDWAWETELNAGGSLAAAARARFVDAQLREAMLAGVRQVVWLGPRPSLHGSAKAESIRQRGRRTGDIEVEVFPLERAEDARRGTRGLRALLDSGLVQSTRTLFVCDGLLDNASSTRAQTVLRAIGDSCYGSRLACVYMNGGLSGGSVVALMSAAQKSQQAVPRLGDPEGMGLDARSLPARLSGAGLVLDADVGITEYARRWLGESKCDLRGYSLCRLATAHVRAPSANDLSAPLN